MSRIKAKPVGRKINPDSERHAHGRLQRQERLIATLYTVSKTLQHTGWSLRFLTQMVLDAAIELAGAEGGALVMFENDRPIVGQSLMVRMTDLQCDAVEKVLIARDLLTQLDQGHEVVCLDDVRLAPGRNGKGSPAAEVSYAFLGTTIKVHRGFFGRLYLLKTHKRGGPFTDWDGHIVGILATHAGSAIHTAFLVNRVMTARSQHIALLESTGEGIYGVDLDGRCTFINTAGACLLGYRPEELIGRSMHALIHHTHEDGKPYAVESCAIYQAYRTGAACHLEDELLFKRDGTGFPAELSSSPLYEGGVLTGAVIAFRDITARKKAEQTVRESEARFRQLAQAVHDVFWISNPTFTEFLYISPAYETVWGRSSQDLYRRAASFLDAVHPDDRQRLEMEFAHGRLSHRERFEREYRIIRPDGTLRWIWERGFPIKNESGQVYRLAGVAEDVTERKHAEHVRAQLVERLITAQEEERQRIARELHDETEQSLASLLVELRAMEDVAPTEAMKQNAGKLRGVTARALDELQRLVQGLCPALLDELGLPAALERLSHDFMEHTGTRVELHAGRLAELRVPPAVEMALYRIVQEALTNAAKHAHATAVSILIQTTAGAIRLVVEDNGCGFDPQHVGRSAAQSGRLGLFGMQERAKMLAGVVTIESAEGRGTTIQLEIPLPQGAAP